MKSRLLSAQAIFMRMSRIKLHLNEAEELMSDRLGWRFSFSQCQLLSRSSSMVVLWLSPRLLLIILTAVSRPSVGCPSYCRCYSLTVECGSLGIKEIPQRVPSFTEVGLQPKFPHRDLPSVDMSAIHLNPFESHDCVAVTLLDVTLIEGR